jgi:hypothetical protein
MSDMVSSSEINTVSHGVSGGYTLELPGSEARDDHQSACPSDTAFSNDLDTVPDSVFRPHNTPRKTPGGKLRPSPRVKTT